jgi:hypothetical protein
MRRIPHTACPPPPIERGGSVPGPMPPQDAGAGMQS